MKKRINSFRFAYTGIFDLFRSQPNARIHLLATIFVILSGFYFQLSKIEWCIIIFAIFAVLAMEAINTAIEYVVDLVSPDHHPLAGKAKDVAAGAVLFMAIGAAIMGIIIFLPKIVLILKI